MTAIQEEADRLRMLDPIARDNRIGSARNAFRDMVANGDVPNAQSLSQAFEAMTDEEKNAGKLIGKLMQARGNQQVEDAFSWFSVEFNNGEPLSDFSKTLALTNAIQTIVGPNPDGYRVLRQVLVKLNTSS